MEPNQPKVPTKQPPHAALRGDAVASVAPTKINTMEVNNKAHKKGLALIKAIGILCHNFNTAGHLKHGQEWNGMQFFPPVIQNAIRKHYIEFPKYCSDNSRFLNDPVFGALAQASTASDYATVVATILCDKRFKMQDWISAPTASTDAVGHVEAAEAPAGASEEISPEELKQLLSSDITFFGHCHNPDETQTTEVTNWFGSKS